jgi:hypothetical protein
MTLSPRLNLQEIESIRRLCAELLGRCSPELVFNETLHRFHVLYDQENLVLCKYCILVLIYMHLVHGDHCMMYSKDLSRRLFVLISRNINDHNKNGKIRLSCQTYKFCCMTSFLFLDEADKLQYALIDLLATIIMVEIRNSGSSKGRRAPFHVEDSASMDSMDHFSVLDQVLYNLRTSSSISFQLCMLNSLTLAIRHLAKQTSSPERNHMAAKTDFIPLQYLATQIVTPLVSLADSNKDSHDLLAALLQVSLDMELNKYHLLRNSFKHP